MFRILNRIICLVLGLAAVQHLSAFSVFVPAEVWQTPTLDYITRYYYNNDSELGGPKNFNEGSRLNVPTITYGYDYTFLDYFGTKGEAAVDSAIAVFNRLPPASAPALNSFLLQDNQAINYTAQALTLTDLKSVTMSIMLEHMGLIGETHVWDLHARAAIPNTTCDFEYLVINRNYDPVTGNPSPYVNGVQYRYAIVDFCNTGTQVADAIEQAVDPTASAQFTFTAVATRYGLQPGGYYLGLTRDDMGGLAYLYLPSNRAYEGLDSNAVAGGYSQPYDPVNPLATNTGIVGFQGLLGGVNKIQYVKVNYDSLLGNGFTPRTYSYTIPWVTNSVQRPLTVTRTVFQPDIIFTASDLVSNTTTYPITYSAYTRGFGYISNGISSVSGGVAPSVITPQEVVSFNTITPVYYNYSPDFLDQVQIGTYPVLLWGSFDGTTNAPVVFPNGASIASLEEQVLEGGATPLPGTFNPISFTTNVVSTGTTANSP